MCPVVEPCALLHSPELFPTCKDTSHTRHFLTVAACVNKLSLSGVHDPILFLTECNSSLVYCKRSSFYRSPFCSRSTQLNFIVVLIRFKAAFVLFSFICIYFIFFWICIVCIYCWNNVLCCPLQPCHSWKRIAKTKSMVLTSLFAVNLDCCVFWTIGHQQRGHIFVVLFSLHWSPWLL